MFATGQERLFLLFCVQSTEEVWNANFMRIEVKKEMRGKSSWGPVGGKWTHTKKKKEKIEILRVE